MSIIKPADTLTALLLTAALTLTVTLTLTACGSSKKVASQKQGPQSNVDLATPSFPSGSTMASVQKRGKINIGVQFNQPGFGLKDSTTGTLKGFDIEIARLVAQGLFGGTEASAEKNINFIEAVSTNREPFLQSGNVDIVIAAYPITDKRKQTIDFAGPYYIAHGDVMIKATETTIKSASDLNGRSVCAVQNSIYADAIRTPSPSADIDQRQTYDQCVQALRNGEDDAMTSDSVLLAGLSQANPGQFTLLASNYTNDPYGIGLKKGDDAFRSFLNDQLTRVEKSGDWTTAFNATLGKLGLATPAPPQIDRYVSTTTVTNPAGSTSAPSTTDASSELPTEAPSTSSVPAN